MSAITAVANHLNIAESLISEIQEWASVLWVRFVSGRPRFVSKKVVKTMTGLSGTEKQVKWAGRILSESAYRIASRQEYYDKGSDEMIRSFAAIKTIELINQGKIRISASKVIETDRESISAADIVEWLEDEAITSEETYNTVCDYAEQKAND